MPNIFRASYIISQPFGKTDVTAEPAMTWNGVYYQNFHRGCDMVGPSDTCPIYACSPGVVFSCGTSHPDGALYVIVCADDGHYECFWHLSSITCQVGESVDNSVQVGNQGTSGWSSGFHCHFECLAAGPYTGLLSMTPVDPAPFIFDSQGATPTDMNPLKIAKDLYEVLDHSYSPPDSVIQDKADAIASTDSLIPVLHDLLSAKPWRSPEDYNFAALEAYATAKGFPDPKQYAFDRVSGGDTFNKVITGDLSADKAQADQIAQSYQAAVGQLTTFGQEIHDLQGQVATLNEENQSLHIVLEKTEQPAMPADQTPVPVETPSAPQPIETPQPATEPAPATQPETTPVEAPASQPEPAKMSYLSGLYYLLSKLFLGR